MTSGHLPLQRLLQLLRNSTPTRIRSVRAHHPSAFHTDRHEVDFKAPYARVLLLGLVDERLGLNSERLNQVVFGCGVFDPFFFTPPEPLRS